LNTARAKGFCSLEGIFPGSARIFFPPWLSAELRAEVRAAGCRLPDQYRLPVLLHHFQGRHGGRVHMAFADGRVELVPVEEARRLLARPVGTMGD